MKHGQKQRGFLIVSTGIILLILLAIVAPPSFAAPAGQEDAAGGAAGTYSNNQDGDADPAFTMALNEDDSVVATLQMGSAAPVVLEGKWLMGATGAISISIREPGSRPLQMVFEAQDDTLTAIRYPQSIFGDAGLTVVRISDQGMTADEMQTMEVGVASGAAASGTAAEPTSTPAVAAAPAEDLSGVYVTPWYPAADAPGLIMVLALYANGNAEETSIYLGKGVVNEIGTWTTGVDDTVEVTMTGTPDKSYDQPSTTTYTVDGDTLKSGNYVFTKWEEVTPEQMDAAASSPPPSEAPGSDDPTGVYMSKVYPAADAPGMLMMLALYANNNAELVTIYLTKGDPVIEVGTWDLNDKGEITLTLTGTPDKEYDQPAAITIIRSGDMLYDGAFAFEKLEQVTPAEMEAMTTAGEAATPSATPDLPEDVAGTYATTQVYPAADASGYLFVLSLFANGNAEQTSIYITKGAITEVGTWTAGEDDTIEVTVTGTVDKTYDSPAATTYTRDGDTLMDGPIILTRLAEVTPEEMDAMTAP